MKATSSFRARVRRFAELNRTYVVDCQDEIAQNNFLVMRRFGTVATLLCAAHILGVAALVRPAWKIAVLMFLMLVLGVTTWIAWRRESAAQLSRRRVVFLSDLMELTIVLYLLFISVFTMPDRTAIYYPAVFMFLPILFVRPVWRTLLNLFAVTVAYMLLLRFFKPLMALNDGATALICLLMGVVMVFLVFDLRIREYAVRSQLRVLGTMDGLTGVNNKLSTERLCNAYLSGEGSGEDCALLMIDVDDFKRVNDVAGHQAGDMVLSAMGEALRTLFRGNDVVGRVGGDEFVVLMKNTGDEELIMDRAAQLWQKLSGMEPGNGLRVSCSVGVAKRRAGDGTMYEQLYAAADQAMYEAKRAGKNRIGIRRATGTDTSVLQRVMVIADDDAIGREIIRRTFAADFEIVEAADGRETVSVMEQYGHRVAVLLLDIGMPVLDGYEVLRTLRASRPTRDIPVVVITADGENELRALELGATDMVRKPLDVKILARRVNNALRHGGR